VKPLRHVGVDSPIEHVRPLGDFVLVRPLKLDAETYSGALVLPESARIPERGLRRGVVVACGPGDKAMGLRCNDCMADYTSTLKQIGESQIFAASSCPRCGSTTRHWIVNQYLEIVETRRPMHVKPGDTVVYPRVPANGARIGNEDLVLLHEQQHILAVIE